MAALLVSRSMRPAESIDSDQIEHFLSAQAFWELGCLWLLYSYG